MQNGQNLEIRASTSQICPVRYVCIPLGGREGATLKEEAAFSYRLRNASSIKSRRRRERKEVAKKEAKYAPLDTIPTEDKGGERRPWLKRRQKRRVMDRSMERDHGASSLICLSSLHPGPRSGKGGINYRRPVMRRLQLSEQLLRFPLSLFFDHSLRVGVGGPLYPYCTYTKHNKALPISPCPSFLFRFRLVHCLLRRVRFHQL